MFCNMINIFTVTLDQFKMPLLNKSYFLKEKDIVQTLNEAKCGSFVNFLFVILKFYVNKSLQFFKRVTFYLLIGNAWFAWPAWSSWSSWSPRSLWHWVFRLWWYWTSWSSWAKWSSRSTGKSKETWSISIKLVWICCVGIKRLLVRDVAMWVMCVHCFSLSSCVLLKSYKLKNK